ncbi:MAG: hypothetical protein CL462_11935 [Acidimicrobiaceae bacterium]|nr:hypothetical protein [Acidimicrobiaceae bacterium]
MRPRSWVTGIATAMWLALSCTATAQEPGRTPEDLQRALQSRYQLIRDSTADFVQTYEGGVLRSTLVERGTFQFKKPGRMRWDYYEPERKISVWDGEQIYFYLPEDRQVMVGRLPLESEVTTPALFLAGAGNFAEDFTATFDVVQDAPQDSYVLRLTPTRTERDFEYLTLVLDGRSLAIVRLVAHDLEGGISTFTFSNLQENQNLSDTPFRFEIPSGTDVIDTIEAR